VQTAAGRRVTIERLRLPAGAVEREHRLGLQALAQRVVVCEATQLWQELGVAAELELRREPLFGRNEPQLLQALRFAARELLVGEVAVCLAAPECKRAPENRRCEGGVSRSGGLRPLREQAFEATRIEHAVLELECVARRPCVDVGRRWKHLAHLRDVHVQKARRGRGWGWAPERVDEDLARTRRAGRDEERCQELPLLQRGQSHGPSFADDLERPEDADLVSLRSLHDLIVTPRSGG
jgi:hypothetical protein